MHIKFLSIVMCALLMNVAFAADDQRLTGLEEQVNLALHLNPADEIQQGFWERARQIESASNLNVEGLFNLNAVDQYNMPSDQHIEVIKYFMEGRRFSDYYAYYCALAGSVRINDRDKLSKELVGIPFFHDLAGRSQETKNNFLKIDFLKALLNCYPVGRLLLAALCYAGANPNQQDFYTDHSYLSEVLKKDDHALAEILLEHGAKPRPEDLKWASTNLDMVNMLIAHGANIKQQHKQGKSHEQVDLLDTFCFNPKSDIRCMRLFLHEIDSKDKNEKLVGRLRSLLFFRKRFEIADWQNRVALLLANASYDIDEVFAKMSVPSDIEEDRFTIFKQAFSADQEQKKKSVATEPPHKRRKIMRALKQRNLHD